MTSILDFLAIGRVLENTCGDSPIPSRYRTPQDGSEARSFEEARQARRKLASDISWAFTRTRINHSVTRATKSKQRYEALGRAKRGADVIIEAIAHDEFQLRALDAFLPDDGPTASEIIRLVKSLEAAVKEERKRLKAAGLHIQAPMPSSTTPGEAFISAMGKAYTEAFSEPPSFDYTVERAATGKFVAFIQAVQRETNPDEEPMSGDAIRKSWSRAQPSDKTS